MPSHRILPNLTSQKTSKIVDHGEGTHFNNDPPRKIGGIRWTFPPIFAHNSPGSPLKLQEVTTSRRYWKLQTLQVFRRFQCEDIGRMGHVAFVKKEWGKITERPLNLSHQQNSNQSNSMNPLSVSAPRGLSFHQPLRAEHRSSTNEYPSAFSSLRAPEIVFLDRPNSGVLWWAPKMFMFFFAWFVDNKYWLQ